jgi:glutamate formiminotransferase
VNYQQTPIHRVVETVRFEAARHGVNVAACELIGLAPLAAFEETIRHYLQIHDFSVEQLIETRLLGLMSEQGASEAAGGSDPSHPIH